MRPSSALAGWQRGPLSPRQGCKVPGLEQFGILHGFGSSHGSTPIIHLAYSEGPEYIPLLRAYIDTGANSRKLLARPFCTYGWSQYRDGREWDGPGFKDFVPQAQPRLQGVRQRRSQPKGFRMQSSLIRVGDPPNRRRVSALRGCD